MSVTAARSRYFGLVVDLAQTKVLSTTKGPHVKDLMSRLPLTLLSLFTSRSRSRAPLRPLSALPSHCHLSCSDLTVPSLSILSYSPRTDLVSHHNRAPRQPPNWPHRSISTNSFELFCISFNRLLASSSLSLASSICSDLYYTHAPDGASKYSGQPWLIQTILTLDPPPQSSRSLQTCVGRPLRREISLRLHQTPIISILASGIGLRIPRARRPPFSQHRRLKVR